MYTRSKNKDEAPGLALVLYDTQIIFDTVNFLSEKTLEVKKLRAQYIHTSVKYLSSPTVSIQL
jgi:hypothetical protein